jgi:hypothetical protein
VNENKHNMLTIKYFDKTIFNTENFLVLRFFFMTVKKEYKAFSENFIIITKVKVNELMVYFLQNSYFNTHNLPYKP